MVAGTGAARVVAGIGVWGHCYVLGIRGPTRRTTVFRHRLDDLVMPVGQAQRKGERLPSGARPGDWRSCGAVHVAYDSGLVVHHTRRCGVAVKLSYTFAVRRDSDRVEAMDRLLFGLSNRRRRRSCRVAVGGPIRWRRSGRPRSSRCWSRCRDCGRSFCSGRCGAAIPSYPRASIWVESTCAKTCLKIAAPPTNDAIKREVRPLLHQRLECRELLCRQLRRAPGTMTI